MDAIANDACCIVCTMQTHCSRYVNGHMKQHGTETGHSLVLSYADISVWCYQCDGYVHHPVSCLCACACACMRACVRAYRTYIHALPTFTVAASLCSPICICLVLYGTRCYFNVHSKADTK